MMPLHSIKNFGEMGAQYFGWMASFNGLVVMLFTPILTRLTRKTRSIRIMVHGILLYAIGFGMLGLIYKLQYFFVSILIFTLGEVLLTISVMPFVVNHTPASHRGRMSAVLTTITGTGYAVGPMAMGRILNFISIEKAWIFIGIFTAMTAVLMSGLEKYEDRENTMREKAGSAVKVQQ